MDSTEYIGMDVHKHTISVAVMNSAGKVVMESILETKAATILQFYPRAAGEPAANLGRRDLGGLVVRSAQAAGHSGHGVQSRKNALLKSGNKSDRIDARKLAELLRHGSLSAALPWREGPTDAEGAVAQLSDDQQGFDAGDESTQGPVPQAAQRRPLLQALDRRELGGAGRWRLATRLG
jgi:hypothetical protein